MIINQMSIKEFIDDLKTISLEEAKDKYNLPWRFLKSMHKGANYDKKTIKQIIKIE